MPSGTENLLNALATLAMTVNDSIKPEETAKAVKHCYLFAVLGYVDTGTTKGLVVERFMLASEKGITQDLSKILAVVLRTEGPTYGDARDHMVGVVTAMKDEPVWKLAYEFIMNQPRT